MLWYADNHVYSIGQRDEKGTTSFGEELLDDFSKLEVDSGGDKTTKISGWFSYSHMPFLAIHSSKNRNGVLPLQMQIVEGDGL